MISLSIEIDEETLKQLVVKYLKEELGSRKYDPTKVTIWVKSKQNYKAEWEEAKFKATYIESSSQLS